VQRSPDTNENDLHPYCHYHEQMRINSRGELVINAIHSHSGGGVISAAKAWAGYLTRPATKNLKIFSEKLK